MRIHVGILFLCLQLACCLAYGQQREFRGIITDSQTGEPVVFATVQVVGLAKGVISNADGGFIIPYHLLPPRSQLRIASMGYQSVTIEVDAYPGGATVAIKLEPRTFLLEEAVVAVERREPSARGIVRRAIRAIPDNYPNAPFSLVGYYRDYQKDSLGYVNLNEAILEAFDAGFETTDSTITQVRIFELIENGNFRRDSMALKPYDYKTREKVIDRAYIPAYGGNEFSILRVHDPVRNYRINSFDFINILESDLLAHHSFRKEKPVYLDGELLHHISFARRRQAYLAEGALFISQDRYAIHKLEYTVYANVPGQPDVTNTWNAPTYPKFIFNLDIEYREYDGRMYLNYISFQNAFEIWLPAKFDLVEFLVDADCRCLVASFTSVPDKDSLERPGGVKVWYKGKKLKIKEVIIHDQSALLIPDMHDLALTEMIKSMRTSDVVNNPGSAKPGDLMKFELSNLVDFRGHLLGHREQFEYIQFREFFTQQVNTNKERPTRGPFMKRGLPLLESIVLPGPESERGFWMNTPLQNPMEATGTPQRR